ncbi:MAG: aldehyde dehydrogenase family protein [Luteitalea sp.]|nr:aldehyde dehydrogenase family protein [Luteitalea sp.]
MIVPTYKNYINGEWVASQSGEVFEKRNPADSDDLIAYFQKSNQADVDGAVAAARAAYDAWRLVPAPRRAEILYRVAQILAERKLAYARDMTREMGKVLAEAEGDVQEAIDMGYLMAGEGRRLFGQTTPSELRDKFAMSVRQPIGVSAMITAWNFPIAVPSWKILPALVCGNTVVFKPAEEAPLCGVNFVQAFVDAGLPKGVLNLVTGDGPGTGAPLVAHPDVRVVSFTGSTETGRRVNETCAPTFKKVHLEMGGKNPILVMDDARLELAVEGAVWGGFGTTGQRCTAASRMIVHERIYRTFVDRFVERAKALRVGSGLDPNIEMGPVISEAQLAKVMQYVEVGKQEGATLAAGGSRLTGEAHARGFFHEPTIFVDVDRRMRIAREEIFGPVVSVIPCRSLEDGIDIANDVAYGLSAAIYTQNINNAFTAMRDIDTGICYVNAPTIGAEVHLPFGGTKATGNGHREAGVAALDVFSEWKTVYVDFSGRLQRAQMDLEEI